MREISIANRHPRLRLDRRAVENAIHVLDENAPRLTPRASRLPEGELSLVFLTDTALAKLHGDFLDDPTITDVITFEGDPAFGAAGEICVSIEAALRHLNPSARSLNSQLSTLNSSAPLNSPAARDSTAFSRELTLYLVHGWLHLAGHDDLVPAKKRAMRRAEARALRLLERANAVPPFTLRG